MVVKIESSPWTLRYTTTTPPTQRGTLSQGMAPIAASVKKAASKVHMEESQASLCQRSPGVDGILEGSYLGAEQQKIQLQEALLANGRALSKDSAGSRPQSGAGRTKAGLEKLRFWSVIGTESEE